MHNDTPLCLLCALLTRVVGTTLERGGLLLTVIGGGGIGDGDVVVVAVGDAGIGVVVRAERCRLLILNTTPDLEKRHSGTFMVFDP